MPETCATGIHTFPERWGRAPKATVPLTRLLIAWAVMLGGMVGFWSMRPYLAPLAWVNCTAGVLFITSKFATLVCMPPKDRRRLSWGRFIGYLFWFGMQPRQFLPEYTPDKSQPVPTVRGMFVNALTAVVFLWILPCLLPADAPQGLRVASGLIGYVFLLMFTIFDAWALLYRACGVPVEKLWHCPLAATSLVDFWGQRWNRIFSGMLRDVMFRPLARRVGAGLALFTVFLYSGLLHENFSIGAGSGYGLPMLYFVIQGLGTWLESRRTLRRVFQRRPWLGRAWTTAVVLGPVTLLLHEGYREQVCVPTLAGLGVPGLEQRQP
jgi:Membrane bound O-acyl transferase family